MLSFVFGKALDETIHVQDKSIVLRVGEYIKNNAVFISQLTNVINKYLSNKDDKGYFYYNLDEDILFSIILSGLFNGFSPTEAVLIEKSLSKRVSDEYKGVLTLVTASFEGYSNDEMIRMINGNSSMLLDFAVSKDKISSELNIVSENQLALLLFLQSKSYEEALQDSLKLGYATNALMCSLAHIKYGITHNYWNMVVKNLSSEDAKAFVEAEKYILERKKSYAKK